MTDGATFGPWLKSARERSRISQERLARITGIDRGHLSKMENDRIDLPRYETRERIHAALGTTEDELVALGIVRPATMRVGTATATARAEPSTPDQFPAIWADLDDDERASMMNIMEALVTRRRLLDAQRPEPEKRGAEDRKRYAP